MRPLIHKFKYLAIFFVSGFVYGQLPTHAPNPQDNTPIDLNNLFDIIVYIVLPIGMLILYFLWRRQVKNNRKNKK
jgi:heme/copper-type cytochrome/quinol oxidase subunit 2